MIIEGNFLLLYPRPVGHATACQCAACVCYVQGMRWQCAHCKQFFKWEELYNRRDQWGYMNHLCATCVQLPVFLPWHETERLGLLAEEDIRDFNALHDWL